MLKLSQKELAEKVYVTPQNLSKWENGLSNPDIWNLCRIAEVLDLSCDYLLGETQLAVAGQAYILRLCGENSEAMEELLKRIATTEPETMRDNAPLSELAAYHGRAGHVEQMVGCLRLMAKAGAPGVPGAMKAEESGAMLSARSAAGFIWPMTESLFGVKPDAVGRTIAFNPHTPIGWDGWKVENMTIGSAELTFESERISPSQCRYTVTCSELGWNVIVMEHGAGRVYPIEGKLSLVMGD